MAHSKTVSRAKAGRFVLTSERGEKISAVEGLKASARVRETVQAAAGRSLSGEARRSLVMESLRKK